MFATPMDIWWRSAHHWADEKTREGFISVRLIGKCQYSWRTLVVVTEFFESSFSERTKGWIMTSTIIISICTLLLISYLFDLSFARTRIPPAILLLLLGWGIRQLTLGLELSIPNILPLLPVLGTVGLILIVMEGALELELNRSKGPLILRSFIGSLLPLVIMAIVISFVLREYGYNNLQVNMVNVLPLCVISSAIAIPSARNLSPAGKEFIIYESSLSDIIGVLLFNFFSLNETIRLQTVGVFGIELLFIIGFSFLATMLLAFLLSRIDHQIKFAPIILLVILIYAISKAYHLPGLIFILLFGLVLGNLDELKNIRFIAKLRPEILNREVHRLKHITIEGTFLVRSLFFLLFGYSIETSDIINPDTLPMALGIGGMIYLFRAVQLKLTRMPLFPVLFIAPRGLITILLYLSIPAAQQIPLLGKSLIVQVILLSSLTMMAGLMLHKPEVQD